MTVSAQFERMPQAFVHAYNREILGWAGRREQRLRLKLANFPAIEALGVAFEQWVVLRADLFKRESDGELRVVIGPDTEADREVIVKHMEVLPRIRQAWHAQTLKQRAMREKVAVRFERVAPAFLQAYRDDILAWGANLRTWGAWRTIMFRRIAGAPPLLWDKWDEPAMLGATLAAKMTQGGVVIEPQTEQDERMIALHAEQIEAFGMPGTSVREH